MADTLPFEAEEDLFTPNVGASSASGKVTVESKQQNFVTLNYDRLLEWSRDRFEIPEPQSLSSEHLFPLKLAIGWSSGLETIFRSGDAESKSFTPSRLDRIVALLTRQESLALLEQLSNAPTREDVHSLLLRFLLTSNRDLHTFASLVDEDLVGLDETGGLTLTEIGERVIRQIASDTDSS